MKKIIKRSPILLVFLFIGFLNQNCGEFNSMEDKNLASHHSSTILDIDLPSSKARVGDRIFVATVFADVFLPVGEAIEKNESITNAGKGSAHLAEFVTSNFNENDKDIIRIISDDVLKKREEFQGGCTFISKDDTCSTRNDTQGRNSDSELDAVSTSTVTREGYRISACNKLIDLDKSIENVIFNLTGFIDTELEQSHIEKIYDLFYPGQEIEDDAYNSLLEVFNGTKEQFPNILDHWRSIIIPICHSIGWQIP